MTAPPAPPRLPAELRAQDGSVRRVGVEMEFAGLDLDAICERAARAVGGRVEKQSAYEAQVVGGSIGDFSVVLDAVLFREMRLRGFLDDLGLERLSPALGESLEEVLAAEARRVVPYEIVFGPIDIPRLGELDAVRAVLAPDAEGTRASILHAFGAHLNPELPRVDAPTILRYLRAFLVLYDELREAHAVDASRHWFTPFINPFPKEYALRVLDPAYAPGTEELMDDYLASNPTRSRPLDLLPAFAWIDEERVRAALPEEKISRRPTLHYRLPNCQIDEPGWSIVGEWNTWMRVEDLAADAEALAARCAERARELESPVRHWIERNLMPGGGPAG